LGKFLEVKKKKIWPPTYQPRVSDQWVALQILDILEQKPTVGQPLKSAAPVDQPVSLYSQKQDVARARVYW